MHFFSILIKNFFSCFNFFQQKNFFFNKIRSQQINKKIFFFSNVTIFTPLEQFEILTFPNKTIFSINWFSRLWNFFSIFFSFSNISFLLSSIFFFSFFLFFFFTNLKTHSKSWFQLFFEIFFFNIKQFIIQNSGLAFQGYSPLFGVLFFILVIFNVLGLFPFGFTFTSHIICTFFYSFIIFFGLNYIAIARYGITFINIFLPSGTPLFLLPLIVALEIVSYFSRPFSLSIRLFANMMAGHALLKILISFAFVGLTSNGFTFFVSFFSLGVIVAILFLELVVAFLQVFVFLTLFSLYLLDVHTTSH